MTPNGTLIAVGGNEFKGFDKGEDRSIDRIQYGILSHIVSQGGGPAARIALITSASRIPRQVARSYRKAFARLGCQHIKPLYITSRQEAESRMALREIENADIVMFSGGDQSRLTRFFSSTEFLRIVKQRYMEDNLVISGTSAGAVAMSNTMISGGSSASAMIKGAVKMRTGLGFIDDVIFDSHFIRRGRFGRLTEAVAHHPNLLGIGLGEDTGLIIKNGNEFQTIGSGMVILFDGESFSHNSVSLLEERMPISIGHMTIHVLANGDKFNLKERSFEFLPLGSPLI